MPGKTNNRPMGRYVLAGVFVLLIVGIWALKFKPVVSKSLSALDYRTNLAWLNGDRLMLVSIDRDQLLVFDVRENMMMPVAGMQNDLRSGALRRFSRSEKQALGVIKRSTSLLFGVVIDGVVETGGSSEIAQKMVKRGLLGLKTTTDLNPIERLILFSAVEKLQPHQIKEAEIPLVLGVVEKLPDGSEVLNIDRARLSLVIDDGLSNDNLRSDTARVVIENGSNLNNMGVLVEKMIKSAGGFVIEVKTGEGYPGWCKYVTAKKTEDSNRALVGWLKGRLFCVRDDKAMVDNENEIKVIVGEKFGEAYSR